MLENDSISIYFKNLFTNLCLQGNLININIENRQFTTSRQLLISHSQKLNKIFGDTQKNQFTIDENLDSSAFGEFINFVNSRNIVFNRCSFDKLLEVYNFCEAPLFRDYLAINAPSLDIQFDFLATYENEGLSCDFLIIKLASKVKEIIENWDKVHDINSHHLIRVFGKADLAQISVNAVFNFVNDTIHKRKENPSNVISVFNLTILPFDDLLKLQYEAKKQNIFIPFLKEIEMNKEFMEHVSQENEDMLDKISYVSTKNVKNMSPVEFKMLNSFKNNADIQVVTKNEQKKITFNLMLIGKENVGKTSLIYRFFIQKFNENKIPQKSSTNHYNYISDLSNIDIIDINGLSTFDNIRDTHIIRTQFFVFVCSLDEEDSIKYIENYYKKICQIRGTSYVPSIVCLNKIDLIKLSTSKILYAKNFALSINAEFFETSAKTGKNVDSIFDKAAEKYSKHSFNSPNFISNENEDK